MVPLIASAAQPALFLSESANFPIDSVNNRNRISKNVAMSDNDDGSIDDVESDAVDESVEQTLTCISILRSVVLCIPRLRKELCHSSHLQNIIYSMLTRYDQVLENLCVLLLDIIASNPRVQATVFRYGLFEMLLLSSCARLEIPKSACRILAIYHELQAEEEAMKIIMGTDPSSNQMSLQDILPTERYQSYLRYYLPEPMIQLLARDGSHEFAKVVRITGIIFIYLKFLFTCFPSSLSLFLSLSLSRMHHANI